MEDKGVTEADLSGKETGAAGEVEINVKGVGQECPTHTGLGEVTEKLLSGTDKINVKSVGQECPTHTGIGSHTGVAHPELAQNKYGWLSRLRSYFFFDPLIWAYTVALGIISIPFGFFNKGGSILHWFAQVWAKGIMKVIVSPVRITGLDKIDFSKAHVYAVNHASALDIPVLYAYLPFQFRILHKKELLAYPIVGWHLKRSGQVCVDQQHPSRSVGQIKSAVRTLTKGMPLVIFPEGGRTADGRIQPFLPGAFFMAIKAQVDIVPIALVGTYELLPMNTYHIKPRPLEMRVGAPISTEGLTLRDMETLSGKVQRELEGMYCGAGTQGTDYGE